MSQFYRISFNKCISVTPTDTISDTDSSDNSDIHMNQFTPFCPIASHPVDDFSSFDQDDVLLSNLLLSEKQLDSYNTDSLKITEFKNTIQQVVDTFSQNDKSDSEYSDSEIIGCFDNHEELGKSDSSTSSYKPFNHETIVNYNSQASKQPFLFRRDFDVLTTIPNNGIGLDLNGANSQGLLCGYLALAGGLYQLDIDIFDFIYSVLDLDKDTKEMLETLRSNPSLQNVQEYQRKFGKLLFDFSTGDLAMAWFNEQIYDFDFLGEGAAVESAESSFSQSTFADRDRLVVLMNNLTQGSIPVYINDESREVLDAHIRLINPDNYHWECVNFKHLT